MAFKDLILNEEEPTPKEKPPLYESKEGFEQVSVLRGYTEVRSLQQHVTNYGAFICGGYVRYMCSPLKNPVRASDVDVYCPTIEIFETLKTMFDEKMSLKVKSDNSMALTYHPVTDYDHVYFAAPAIQLIRPMTEGRVVTMGDMETILKNFDFTVIRAGLLSDVKALVDADFLHDESKKILRLKNIHCPVSSTLRCCKYAQKGYWLPPMQALKLFLDWDSRDDSYRDKLKDFLEKANGGDGLSKEDIEQLEAMMRID